MKYSFLAYTLLFALPVPHAQSETKGNAPAELSEISADQDLDILPGADSDEEEPVEDQEQAEKDQRMAESISREILQRSQRLWMLLSQIDSKETADAAAAQFRELTIELVLLDQQLGDYEQSSPKAVNPELNHSIIESYQHIDNEFSSLYRARCFGSTALYRAFDEFKGSNFFDTTMLPTNHPVLPKLSAKEEKIELQRLKKLIAPDVAILKHLSQIADIKSAKLQCKAIIPYLQKLDTLRPQTKYLYRHFARTSDENYCTTRDSLQRILWNMRTEYVRIAALPLNPQEKSHELLASTLDELYYNLEVTHHYWFSVVFDNSFLIDMDEAFRESEMELIRNSL